MTNPYGRGIKANPADRRFEKSSADRVIRFVMDQVCTKHCETDNAQCAFINDRDLDENDCPKVNAFKKSLNMH